MALDNVTVVVPVKNEERSLEEVLHGIFKHTKSVIVVDGHSDDRSREVATSAGARVLLDNGLGKGDAIRTAIPEITDEITVFIDGDGSHNPDDIPALVAPIKSGEFDHVSASRLIGGSSELHGGFDEFMRLAGSSFITACINWRFKVRLSDSQNGFRAIRTDVLKKLNLQENSTTIEQEMIIKTLKLGYRLGEVPAHEHPRKYGSSHIALSRVWHLYLWSLIRNLFF
ncbi:MAG: glycosyltransferase family 2 protein [Candidatus Dadabacteria bacterium]|nr:MAG: glycosyltransferase family 2 protein [Candidatus Dadabacteria bacterium]